MYSPEKVMPINIKIDHRAKRNNIILNIRRVIVYTILIIISAICLFWFYILLINATHSHSELGRGFYFVPGKFFVQNWNSLWHDPQNDVFLDKALINSFIIAFSSAVLTVYFSTMTAYAIHKYKFKGRGFIYTFILCVMMIPTQISGLGLVKMITSMGLLDTYWPLILPGIASPIVFFYMKQYLDSILPGEMVEAARVDGANEVRIFHQIVLPVLKPAMALQFIFSFVSSWNNYFIPALVIQTTTKRTVPLIIAQLNNDSPVMFNYGRIYILIGVSIIPLIIIYLIFSKFIISNLTNGSVKG